MSAFFGVSARSFRSRESVALKDLRSGVWLSDDRLSEVAVAVLVPQAVGRGAHCAAVLL